MKQCISICCAVCILFGCSKKEEKKIEQTVIAVFVPGVIAGSAIYEMLVTGVQTAATEFSEKQSADVTVTVIEGGYNQAEWESKLTSLAASNSYNLIVSSNPSLPALAMSVSDLFPHQQFLLLDGEIPAEERQYYPNIYTLRYNQREQAYVAGYIAELVALEHNATRIGLIAGQEYTVMQDTILPGYREGAQAVHADATVDFRVVGNWSDAGKAAELAQDMIRNGVAVILTIAGGANEGTVQAASEAGAKVVWFDTNGYSIRPGVIVGSAVLYQEKAAYEKTMLFLTGDLPFGTTELVGFRDGYVDFIEDDPNYHSAVSALIREKQSQILAQIRSGTLNLN
ncbi:BMP family ABC transporter substrate-binding protein [Pillotina sp. SPG140]|jgi:simple sugar transport system substrate-binding protein